MTTPQENLILILTGAKVEPPKKNAIYEALMQCEKREDLNVDPYPVIKPPSVPHSAS